MAVGHCGRAGGGRAGLRPAAACRRGHGRGYGGRPAGCLGLLPIHAAGHHTEPLTGDQARRTVMDRVISSWTPTIRALRYARQHHPSLPAGRALIVAMPATPGLPGGGELPNVPMEVARVRALLPDTVLLAEPGDQHSERLPLRSLPGRTCSTSSPAARSPISPATASATRPTLPRACCCSTTTTGPTDGRQPRPRQTSARRNWPTCRPARPRWPTLAG